MTAQRRNLMYLSVVLGLLLQGCAPIPAQAPPPETIKLKVLTLPYLSNATLYIGEEEGHFAEQGLQIEFVEMGKNVEALPILAQGDADVMAGSPSVNTLNAIAQGVNIKAVADKGFFDPAGCTYMALIARRSLIEAGELQDLKQLQGRRIYFNPTSTSGYLMEQLLKSAGLSADDIEVVKVPVAATLDGFEKGTLDLAVLPEPWITQALKAGNADVWIPMEREFPGFQLGLLLYGPTLLDENPDAGRRFMVAYLKAVGQYNQGKTDRNLEIVAKYTGLDQGLVRQACWPSIHDDEQINVQSVLDFQAWVVEKGYLDSPVTEERFWDPSFVEYANQVLGTTSQ